MHTPKQQSKPDLRMDAFEAEMVEAAGVYHLQVARSKAKGYMPVEVAAFIAGACWARQVLVGEEKNKED